MLLHPKTTQASGIFVEILYTTGRQQRLAGMTSRIILVHGECFEKICDFFTTLKIRKKKKIRLNQTQKFLANLYVI